MSSSIREQLEVLFDRRNETVHSNFQVPFSSCFKHQVGQYDIDLEELSKLLIRGMKPGKAIRRLLEARLKVNANVWADREGLVGADREEYIKGFRENGRLDATVQELTEAYNAPSWAKDILFAETPEEIQYVYQHGPESCMVDEFATQIAGMAYGFAEDLAVAYRQNNGKITARAVVNIATRRAGRLYGDESSHLGYGLEELGYVLTDEDYGSPVEGVAIFIPTLKTIKRCEWEQTFGLKTRYWHISNWRWGTSYREIKRWKVEYSLDFHAPWIDWATALIPTTQWEWKEAFGRRWHGCWMRPIYYDKIEVVNLSKRRYEKMLVDRDGDEIKLQPDEIDELWEFHPHARPSTPLYDDEDLYQDPFLKWADYE